MIFVFPIAIAIGTIGAGLLAGADGMSKMNEAKMIGEAAQLRYEKKRRSVENTLKATQALAKEYGKLQILVKLQTIKRFVTFIERMGQRVSQSGDTQTLGNLEGISLKQVQEYKATVVEATSLLTGGVTAAGAAYAAGSGTVALVGLFGTASTGAAISGLGGAAAWNATLAWLGGGSLAAGGGGMALGTLVLGGITIGPALMIGGFALGVQGEEALTEACRYHAQVNVEIAKLEAFEAFLKQVQRQIRELMSLINILNDKAVKSLAELEATPFELERDAKKFQQTALLVKALSEIMKTPVLSTGGSLNPSAATLKTKCCNMFR
jgi:hypothetical protein